MMEKTSFTLFFALFWFCAAIWMRVSHFNQSRKLKEKEDEHLRTSKLVRQTVTYKTFHKEEVKQLRNALYLTHVRFCLATCCCIGQLVVYAGFRAFSG